MKSIRKYFYLVIVDESRGAIAEIVRFILWIVSFVYRLCLEVMYFLYHRNILKKVSVRPKVISIGNITWGGVGKTPLVEYVVTFLQSHQIKPAILSRGYMGGLNKSDSDEVKLLRQSLKDVSIFVGLDRAKLAQEVSETNLIDSVVLDDGFQHWKLKRDLDIVAIDASNPFGNGCLIPRGVLREPLEALKRAQIFVLTRTDIGRLNVTILKSKLAKINPQALVVEAIHKPLLLVHLQDQKVFEDVSFLQNKNICCFCSVGNPDSFLATLESQGAIINKSFIFMDHHLYKPYDLQQINSYCQQNKVDCIITTHKDAVKLTGYLDRFSSGIQVFYLKISIEIFNGQKQFHDRILSLFNR